jgi:hypothetical protein
VTIDFSCEDKALLNGVVELHVHPMPDVFDRPYDQLTLARQARDAGYRAILFKCHSAINADCASLVGQTVRGLGVFGGIVLNHAVGGLNPHAVEAAIGFGAKEVWMPTMHAAHHIEVFGVPTYPWHKPTIDIGMKDRRIEGITIFTAEGEVKPEVYEILGLIADADIIVGTGHLSLSEAMTLIDVARKQGVAKILVTHPEWEATHWSVDDQVKMAEKGAVLEHCINALMPFRAASDPKQMVEAIRRVGATHCVMATDYGQYRNPHPIEGMRHFIHLMMEFGVTLNEIEVMTKENPSKLLGL